MRQVLLIFIINMLNCNTFCTIQFNHIMNLSIFINSRWTLELLIIRQNKISRCPDCRHQKTGVLARIRYTPGYRNLNISWQQVSGRYCATVQRPRDFIYRISKYSSIFSYKCYNICLIYSPPIRRQAVKCNMR